MNQTNTNDPPVFTVLSDAESSEVMDKMCVNISPENREYLYKTLKFRSLSSPDAMGLIYSLIDAGHISDQSLYYLVAAFYKATGDHYFKIHRVSSNKPKNTPGVTFPPTVRSRGPQSILVDDLKLPGRMYKNNKEYAPLSSEHMWDPNKNPGEYAMHIFLLDTWRSVKDTREHIEAKGRSSKILDHQFKWYYNGAYSHYGWKGEYDKDTQMIRIVVDMSQYNSGGSK